MSGKQVKHYRKVARKTVEKNVDKITDRYLQTLLTQKFWTRVRIGLKIIKGVRK